MSLFAHIISTEHSGSSAFGNADDYINELMKQVEESKEEDVVLILADYFSMASLVPFYHSCTNKKKFNDKIKPVLGLKITVQADSSIDFILDEGNYLVDDKGRLIVDEKDFYKVILDKCTTSFDEENNITIIKQGRKTIVDESNRVTEDGSDLIKKFEPELIKKSVFDKDHDLLVVAKNETGRRNINNLVTAGYKITLLSKYKKVTFDQLKDYSDGLMVISGGKNGAIESAIENDDFDLSKKRLSMLENIFDKDDTYLQVLRVENTVSGQVREDKIIEGFKKLQKEGLGQLFVSNDVRFPKKSNYKDVIYRKKAIEKNEMYDPSDIIDISEEQYLKPTAEMIELFSDLPEAVINTIKMANKTDLKNYRDILYQSYLPKFPIPKEFDNLEGISEDILNMEDGAKKDKEIVDFKSSKFLRSLSFQGLEDRWDIICRHQNLVIGEKSSKGILVTEDFIASLKKEYVEQMEMELEVIHRTGFPGYFLIVQDVTNWCLANDIPVGPGRGSGAGSIVLYCLNITDIDSMEHNLLFERFLNPERVGEPDIDIDFSPRQRQRVIKYMADKYGLANTAQILTCGTMAAKAVVDDVGRVLGMQPADRIRIKDLISGDPGTKLRDELDPETGNEKLLELRASSPQINMLLTTALELEGSTKSYGKHAGGVVVSFGPMNIYGGLYREAKDQGVTENKELEQKLLERGIETLVPTVQVDKNLCETVGLIKFDFLGLKNLDIIDDCIKFINKSNPDMKDLKANELSPHDEVALSIFKEADTYGIFQFESPAMRRLMKKMTPDSFSEVIALVALFRPGPLQSGMADDFVNRKHGVEKVVYPHRDLSELLKTTYGTIIYQEQVMQISRILAGFTRGEADTLRKAMGKKLFDLMKQMRQLFAEGAGHKYRQETIETTSKRFKFIHPENNGKGLDINLEDVTEPFISKFFEEKVEKEVSDRLVEKFGYYGKFISTKEQVVSFLQHFALLSEDDVLELEAKIDLLTDVEFFKSYKEKTLESGIPILVKQGMTAPEAELLLSRAFIGSGMFVRFNEIFSKMNEFAAYGFNESHSVAYATVSMQTAYLKAHYPSQYMSALLSNDSNLEKLAETARECRRMGLIILPPDINESSLNFVAGSGDKKEKKIRYGLGQIRAVSNKAQHIINKRAEHGKINDIYEFYKLYADYKTHEIVQKDGVVKEQNSRVIDITVLNALLNSGALDSLCPENDNKYRSMLLSTYHHINNTFTDLGKRLKKNYGEVKKKINAKSTAMTHADLLNGLKISTLNTLNLKLASSKEETLLALESKMYPDDVTNYDIDFLFDIYNTADKLVSTKGIFYTSKEFILAINTLIGVNMMDKLDGLSLNMVLQYAKSNYSKLDKSLKTMEKNKEKKKIKKKEKDEIIKNIEAIKDSDEFKFAEYIFKAQNDDVDTTPVSTDVIEALAVLKDCFKNKQIKYSSVFDLETELKTSHTGEEVEMKEYTVAGTTHYYVSPTAKETDLVPLYNTKERAMKEFDVTGMYQTTHPLLVDGLVDSLKAEDFNIVPLNSMLGLISQKGNPAKNKPSKHYLNSKIAGSILSISDYRGFNEKTERMETRITLVIDDGTGIVQAKFTAEDIFTSGREDQGIKMLIKMSEKRQDILLLEGSLTQGNYESEGPIMYADIIGSANPDIYLPVESAKLNSVNEITIALASPPQLNFVRTLLRRNGVEESEILENYEIDKLELLNVVQASELIGIYN